MSVFFVRENAYYATHHGGVVAHFYFNEMTLFLDCVNQRVGIGNIPSGITKDLKFCGGPSCLQDTVGQCEWSGVFLKTLMLVDMDNFMTMYTIAASNAVAAFLSWSLLSLSVYVFRSPRY
jgi:hypothetical protein